VVNRLTECEMQCLAWAIVLGRSMKSWAEAHGFDIIFARESSRLPEVTGLIASHRKRLARRTAASVKKALAQASEERGALFPGNSSDASGFVAQLALLRRRLAGLEEGTTEKRLANLKRSARAKRLASLKRSTAAKRLAELEAQRLLGEDIRRVP
jgi:hypothetical protein